jgi:hypothetical protein
VTAAPESNNHERVISHSNHESWSNFIPIERRHDFKKLIASGDQNCTQA